MLISLLPVSLYTVINNTKVTVLLPTDEAGQGVRGWWKASMHRYCQITVLNVILSSGCVAPRNLSHHVAVIFVVSQRCSILMACRTVLLDSVSYCNNLYHIWTFATSGGKMGMPPSYHLHCLWILTFLQYQLSPHPLPPGQYP